MPNLTLWWDGRTPVQVDQDEFEIIKMMIREKDPAGGIKTLLPMVRELESQGYSNTRAKTLAILARGEVEYEYLRRSV
jgi:hypothetical protein